MKLLLTPVSLAALVLLGACASPPPAAPGSVLKMEPLLRIGATPPSAEQAFAAGRKALADHRAATALAWFELMVVAQPGSARAHNGRAVALARLGRPTAAVQALEQALRLDAQAPYLHANLGRVLVQAGEPGRGLHSLEAALRLAPGDAGLQAEADRLRQRLAAAAPGPAQPGHEEVGAPSGVAAADLPTSVQAALPLPADADGSNRARGPARTAVVAPEGPPQLATARQRLPAAVTASTAPRWIEVAPRQFELRPGAVPATTLVPPRTALPTALVLPPGIQLEVSNGAGEAGLARRTAQRLAALGTPSKRITNHRHFHVEQTTVEFRPAQREAASAVARSLGLTVEMVPTQRLVPGVSVRVLLGRDARSTTVAGTGAAELPAL